MFPKRVPITAVLFLMLLISPLSSAPLLVPDKIEETAILGDYLERFDDPSGAMTIEQVSALENSRNFQIPETAVPNIKFSDTAVWFRFRSKSGSGQPFRWILEIDYPLIDSIELYRPTGTGGYEFERAGETDRRGLIQTHYMNPYFFMTSPADIPYEYYIRVSDEGSVAFPGLIHSEETFRTKIALKQIMLGIYYGLILGLTVYNLFLFLTVRDISYLHYVFYVASYSALQFIFDGYANIYLWPNASPWAANRMILVISPLFVFWLLNFTRAFLETGKAMPNADRLLRNIAIFNLIFAPLAFVLNYAIVAAIWIVVALFGVVALVYAAVRSFKSGYRPARFFITAFSAFLIGGVLWGLRFLDIVPSNFFTENMIRFGSAAEILLLSIALGDKINIMKKENLDAQKEIIESKQKALELQESLTIAYQRFVPQEFLINLGKSSIIDIRLGDQTQKIMSVLFSDIRNFTSISEKLSASENFAFINEYLGAMGPLVRKNSGYIDKYIGDSIMALFSGNPSEAINTAIGMIEALHEYNERENNPLHLKIKIGIGINTGNLMLGTVGEANRLEGTVISDDVNLASRIESMTKKYGSEILISEYTRDHLDSPERYDIRFVDTVRVKGKHRPVSLYEVFSTDPEDVREKKRALQSLLLEAWDHFNHGHYEVAKRLYGEILERNPGDRLAKSFLIRIERENRPLVHSSVMHAAALEDADQTDI